MHSSTNTRVANKRVGIQYSTRRCHEYLSIHGQGAPLAHGRRLPSLARGQELARGLGGQALVVVVVQLVVSSKCSANKHGREVRVRKKETEISSKARN